MVSDKHALEFARTGKPDTYPRSSSTMSVETKPSQEATQEWRPTRWTLWVVLSPIFLVNLDVFVTNVAVPAIQRSLHASSAPVQFLVAGYSLAYATVLITGGRLGDSLGRRKTFAASLALFLLASLLCACAPNAAVLVIGRIVQGLGAGLMTPQALAMVTTLFTGAARTKAFVVYGLAAGLGGVLGQLVGGLLIQWNLWHLDWRLCFLVNLPFGIALLAGMRRHIPESTSPHPTKLDVPGAILLAVALTAVVLPLVEGREQHWPAWSWILLAAAAPLLAVFAFYQRSVASRGRTPLIDLTLFKERSFSAGFLVDLAYAASTASFFLLMAIYLQEGCGLTALDAGGLALSLGLGFLFASFRAPKLAVKLGRQVLALGALIQVIGLIGLYVTVAHIGVSGSVALLAPSLLVFGIGSGLVLAPVASIALSRVAPQNAGAGAGALSTSLLVGNSLGVAIVGVVFYGRLGQAGIGSPAFATALKASLWYLGAFSILVAVLAQLLPGRPGRKPAGG
jgi:EmrB/QacA subfamily drug resistance transporter